MKTFKRTALFISALVLTSVLVFMGFFKFSLAKSDNAHLPLTAIRLAESVYINNQDGDMSNGGFEWAAGKNRGWIYHNGFMMDALMQINPLTLTDFTPYVEQFYDDNIDDSGMPKQYYRGEVDSVAAINGVFNLLTADGKGHNEERYRTAIQYVFHELMEVQKRYPGAGDNFIHKQQDDEGNPPDNWKDFPIGLDGAYMSKIFMYRCADAIDNKNLKLKWNNGTDVSSEELRRLARNQLTWMSSAYNPADALNSGMRDLKTGLVYHGYNLETNAVNGIFWGRGIGWLVMACVQSLDYEDDEHKGELINMVMPTLDGLLEYADEDTGLWRNLPTESAVVEGCDNRLETSASAMFAYAYLKLASEYPQYLGSFAGTYKLAGMKAYDSIAQDKIKPENGRPVLIDTYLSSSVCTAIPDYFKNGYVANSALGIAPFLMATPYMYSFTASRDDSLVRYTVRFDANGGEGYMDNVPCVYGQTTTLPRNTFTRKGYVFAGWNTAPDRSGRNYKDCARLKTACNTDGDILTLYARWDACRYTVQFNAKGGSGKMPTVSCKYGTATTLPQNAFERTGYVFTGWNTAPDGSGRDYKDCARLKTACETDGEVLILYAKWRACRYTVRFEANGGEGMMEELPCKYGKTTSLPECAFVRDGYTFDGWNTKPDGSGKNYKDGARLKTACTKDGQIMKLYAKWKKND